MAVCDCPPTATVASGQGWRVRDSEAEHLFALKETTGVHCLGASLPELGLNSTTWLSGFFGSCTYVRSTVYGTGGYEEIVTWMEMALNSLKKACS